jgi:hypothetical protein
MKPFDPHDPSSRALVSALKRRLQELLEEASLTESSVEAAVAEVLQAFPPKTPRNDTLETLTDDWGLFYAFTDSVPRPTLVLYPIDEVLEGPRLPDHSRPAGNFVATRSGQVLVYPVVSLGSALFSEGPAGVTAAACVVRGKLFYFDDVLRRQAERTKAIASAIATVVREHGETLTVLGGVRMLPTLFLRGNVSDWARVRDALEVQWLWERVLQINSGIDDAAYTRVILAQQKLALAYHEVAGHLRDQLDTGQQRVPLSLSGLYEARASLAVLAYSDDPTYALLELVTFMIAPGFYHHEYAEKALTALFGKLQRLGAHSRLSPGCVVEYAQALDPAECSRLRQVALELLEGEFALSAAVGRRERTTPQQGDTMQKPEDVRKMFEIVQDPRYSEETFLEAVQPTASLKQELIARGLLQELNRQRGWSLSPDGNWTTKQSMDLVYDVVLAPGYDQEAVLRSLTGKAPRSRAPEGGSRAGRARTPAFPSAASKKWWQFWK